MVDVGNWWTVQNCYWWSAEWLLVASGSHQSPPICKATPHWLATIVVPPAALSIGPLQHQCIVSPTNGTNSRVRQLRLIICSPMLKRNVRLRAGMCLFLWYVHSQQYLGYIVLSPSSPYMVYFQSLIRDPKIVLDHRYQHRTNRLSTMGNHERMNGSAWIAFFTVFCSLSQAISLWFNCSFKEFDEPGFSWYQF